MCPQRKVKLGQVEEAWQWAVVVEEEEVVAVGEAEGVEEKQWDRLLLEVVVQSKFGQGCL